MSTKHGFLPVLELPMQTDVPSISRHASHPLPKDYRNWLTGLRNTTVATFAWDLPASTGFLFLIFWRRITSWLLSHPKYTKPQKGNKTDRKDAKWICDLLDIVSVT